MYISTITIVIIHWIISNVVPDFDQFVGQKTLLISQGRGEEGGGGKNLHYLESNRQLSPYLDITLIDECQSELVNPQLVKQKW